MIEIIINQIIFYILLLWNIIIKHLIVKKKTKKCLEIIKRFIIIF